MKTGIFTLCIFFALFSGTELRAAESEIIIPPEIKDSLPERFFKKVKCRGGMRPMAGFVGGYYYLGEVARIVCVGVETVFITGNSAFVDLKCEDAPGRAATKVVTVEGRDYCIVQDAFRHPPDCQGKFKEGAKARLMIQQGEDYCVSGSEQLKSGSEQLNSGSKRFKPDCQGKNYVHELRIDEQAHQDVCLPRPLRLSCSKKYNAPSHGKVLKFSLLPDYSENRDVCEVKMLYYESPRLE